MPRVSVGYRTASKDTYKRFKENHPEIKIDYLTWSNIIYTFNYAFRDYVLETGILCKYIHGFGDFAITKWKPSKTKILPTGEETIALPIDWKKTKEHGKYIFHMNYNTDGYKFKWKWFNRNSKIFLTKYWNFKPSRVSSRLLKHYISLPDYQDKYLSWRR